MKLVVWTGPVADFQIPGATLRGVTRKFISCTGDGAQTGKPDCPNLGEQVMHSPEVLYAKVGVRGENVNEIYWGAFSAGGSLVKRCLMDEDYRKLTSAVHLADATYTSLWADAQNRIPPPIEGFTRYAVDVSRGPGDKLFIATASPNPNKQWGTGIENLKAIRAEVERRTGKSFVPRKDFFGIEPAPEEVWQLGNVIFAFFPAAPLGHGHTKIADQIWQGPIQKWVDKGKGPIDSPKGLPPKPPKLGEKPYNPPLGSGLGGDEMLILGGIAVGVFLLYKVLTRS